MAAGGTSTRAFKEEIRLLRQYLEEEGRDPKTFTLSKRVYMLVDRDKERAKRRVREWFASYSGIPDRAERVAVTGSEEECTEKLSEVASEGIDLLIVNPLYDFEEQAGILARDILPKLR